MINSQYRHSKNPRTSDGESGNLWWPWIPWWGSNITLERYYVWSIYLIFVWTKYLPGSGYDSGDFIVIVPFYVPQTVTLIKLTRVNWGNKSGVTVWETIPFSRFTFLTSTNPQTFVSIRFSFSDCAWLIDNKWFIKSGYWDSWKWLIRMTHTCDLGLTLSFTSCVRVSSRTVPIGRADSGSAGAPIL